MSTILADAPVSELVPLEFQYERRGCDRVETSGWVMACFREEGQPPRLVSLRLHDFSNAGLGVFIDRPIAVDTPFDLFSPGSSAPTRFGTVARCTREGTNCWRLGLAFGRQALAA